MAWLSISSVSAVSYQSMDLEIFGIFLYLIDFRNCVISMAIICIVSTV